MTETEIETAAMNAETEIEKIIDNAINQDQEAGTTKILGVAIGKMTAHARNRGQGHAPADETTAIETGPENEITDPKTIRVTVRMTGKDGITKARLQRF